MQHKENNNTGESRRFHLAPGLLFASALWALLICWLVLPIPPAFVEQAFSRNWYRSILRIMTPVTEPVSFPIALIVLILGVSGFLSLWVRKWIRIRRARDGSHWSGFFWGSRVLLAVLPVLGIWFVIFWGAGYRRLSVDERLQLDTKAISQDEAVEIRDMLLETIRQNPAISNRDSARAVRSIAAAMSHVVEDWDGRPITLPRRVKSVPSGLLLAGGASGMCAPFTLEALVDNALPDAAFVYCAAHELGHLAGFCAEDEASFAGYVAGLKSDDAFARYSCALSAYMDLISQSGEAEFKRNLLALPESARRDVKKADEAYRKYNVQWFSRIAWRAYNEYLQAQGVPEGVRSYSYGIRLFGYAWRKGLVNAGPSRTQNPD